MPVFYIVIVNQELSHKLPCFCTATSNNSEQNKTFSNTPCNTEVFYLNELIMREIAMLWKDMALM